MMFCPRCGKTEGEFYEGFCVECFKKTHSLTRFPKVLELKKCGYCKLVFSRGKWLEEEDALFNLAKQKTKTSLYEPRFQLQRTNGFVVVRFSGFADKAHRLQVSEESNVRLAFFSVKCPLCSKLIYRDFEVKLQLRGSYEGVQRLSRFVQAEAARIAERDERARVFWNREEKKGKGVDFFFGFRDIGEAIVRNLRSKHGLAYIGSRKLQGIDKHGRSEFKITFCIRA